jgi:HKD family nuclease
MIIEGVNLMRTRRAYIAYLEYCTRNSKDADEKAVKEYWDPEIKATEELIKAVDQNIKTENTNGG